MKTKCTIILVCLISLSVYGQKQVDKKEFNENGSISFMRFSIDKENGIPIDIAILFKDSLGVRDGNVLKLVRSTKDDLGFQHQYHDQYYKGIRVEYGTYSVHSKNGQINYITGIYQAIKDLQSKPELSERAALAFALKIIGADKYIWQDTPRAASFKNE